MLQSRRINYVLEKLVILLIQSASVFAPKFLGLVHRRPLESTRLDLARIDVERAATPWSMVRHCKVDGKCTPTCTCTSSIVGRYWIHVQMYYENK